jgi:hypothetical protein
MYRHIDQDKNNKNNTIIVLDSFSLSLFKSIQQLLGSNQFTST